MKIAEKDLYCIARIMQSLRMADGNPFAGCKYCKCPCHTEKELAPNYDRIMAALQDATGVVHWLCKSINLDRALSTEKERRDTTIFAEHYDKHHKKEAATQ